MSLGSTLRSAREAKGLTTSELAARTHILIQIIEGLENGDYHRIPAAIYGRGFVKLYCEAVGLDPRPLQAEFMTLYTQSKNAPAKMQMPTPPPAPKPPPAVEPVAPPPPVAPEPVPIAPPPAPPVMPEPEPVAPPPPVAPEPEPIAPPPPQAAPEPEPIAPPPPPPKKAPEPEPVREPEPSNAEPPRRDYGDLFEQTYAQEDDKPSAAQKFRDTMTNVSSGVFSNVRKLPPNTGRIVTVAVAGIIVLALIVWGIFELYKATTPQTEGDAPVAVNTKPEAPKPSEAKQPAATQTKPEAKPAAQKPTKPTAKANDAKPADATAKKARKNVKSGDLRSSGIDVPPLYID